MSKPRILGLVDAENLYYTPRKRWGPGARIDFYKLYKIITAGGCRNSQVIIYLVADPIVNQIKFIDRLKHIGYTPRMKVIYPEKGKFQNSNWDPEIIEDAMAKICDFNKLVMVSGDGGFSPTLQAYLDQGKETAVLCFDSNFSAQLRSVAETVTFLDENILFRKNNHRNSANPSVNPRPKPLESCRFPMS